MRKAHLTAVSRKQPSLPMRRLSKDGHLEGRGLDYGCGRGFDAEHFGFDGYDPHYRPEMPEGQYRTVVSNFVLNVIESDEERRAALRAITGKLEKDGVAYVSVRNDRHALAGRTSRGTWQGLIVLDLPVVYKTSGYITYKLTRGGAECDMRVEFPGATT